MARKLHSMGRKGITIKDFVDSLKAPIFVYDPKGSWVALHGGSTKGANFVVQTLATTDDTTKYLVRVKLFGLRDLAVQPIELQPAEGGGPPDHDYVVRMLRKEVGLDKDEQ